MKKTLAIVLALVFVLSIAGTAFAASNPFVDVPAKHWAYGAVSQLAKAGIVDGMGDGTFRGDKTMTRYEMAQIVAKAMAKSDKADAATKALVDKLAVEFAAELNNLGVRVAKLEAKTNVALTYESRIRFMGDDKKDADVQGINAFDFRQRIYLAGAVNETVTYGARLEAVSTFGAGAAAVSFNRAFFNIKDFMGLDQVTVGRFSTLTITNGLLNGSTSNNDGVLLTQKFGDVTMKAFVIDPKDVLTTPGKSEIALVNFDFKLDNAKFNIAAEQNGAAGNDTRSYNVGTQIKMGGVTLTADYVTSKLRVSNTTAKAYAVQITNGTNGYYFPITTKIVNEKKPHTDAFALSYRSIENGAVPTISGFAAYLGTGPASAQASTVASDNNVKGWFLAYQNVISKNIVMGLEYQDLKDKVGANTDKCYSANFQFFF